jgi:hypothetical protein
MTDLRLGIVGMSDGNGHPYSWSAICNGYDPVAMEDCGFPVIPRYLAERKWPEDRLPGVAVTHVWAQDPARARHIAKAALIETVVERPEQMIGEIDGLLLARDDAENHASIAMPFLAAGVPVYLDKAAALTIADLDRVWSLQRTPGLIFTGTALRYARELSLDQDERAGVGTILHIFAVTPKSWDRYAVHVVEPVLALQNMGPIIGHRVWAENDARGVHVTFESGVQAHFAALGDCEAPIALRIIGDTGWRDLVFEDSFSCFRAALAEFVRGIRAGASATDYGFVRGVVDILERGRA